MLAFFISTLLTRKTPACQFNMSRAVKYLLVLGVPPLALAGGLHMYRKRLADNKAVSPEDFNGAQREKILEGISTITGI